MKHGIKSVCGDMTSHGGFVWPKSGPVTAPDWRDDFGCGGGLHFLLAGQNSPGTWYDGGKSLVLEVDDDDIRTGSGELLDKAKCRRCIVVFCGSHNDAIQYLVDRGSVGPWYMSVLTGGHGSVLTGGHGSVLTGGNGSVLTGGDRSVLTGGHGSTLTGGNGAVLSCLWWDRSRNRICVGYVGEDGIEPNVAYRCDNGIFVAAKGGAA